MKKVGVKWENDNVIKWELYLCFVESIKTRLS
jgi:hypothetical protein